VINKVKKYWSIYKKLAKHRLSVLVTFSAAVGYFIAQGRSILELGGAVLGVYLLSAGASALNQYQERKYDAQMERTNKRPIPAKEISANSALTVALVLILAGSMLLYFNGIIPVVLGLLNIILYNVIYTPLKTRTPFSILPGAVVGAIPPMIGWTSAGLSLFHPTIIYIAVFMFLWQLPHFWLLLIKFGGEYEKAGFSSISRYFNTKQIKHIVFFWAGISSLFLFFFPVFSIQLSATLTIILIVFNLFFIGWFHRIIYGKEEKKAIRGAFILINSYMMVALIIFVINSFF
jgi:protoheme IX farnesyltransferase